MIKSFKHKGLEKFFAKGTLAGINPQHAKRLRLILAMLDNAKTVTDMNSPALKFHELMGKSKGEYSVTVQANWRITFQFTNGDAYVVNYEDYH